MSTVAVNRPVFQTRVRIVNLPVKPRALIGTVTDLIFLPSTAMVM